MPRPLPEKANNDIWPLAQTLERAQTRALPRQTEPVYLGNGSFVDLKTLETVESGDEPVFFLDKDWQGQTRTESAQFEPVHDGRNTPSRPPQISRNGVRFGRLHIHGPDDRSYVLWVAVKPVASIDSITHEYGALKKIAQVGTQNPRAAEHRRFELRTFTPVGIYKGMGRLALITELEHFSNLHDYTRRIAPGTSPSQRHIDRGYSAAIQPEYRTPNTDELKHMLHYGAVALATLHRNRIAHGDAHPGNFGDDLSGRAITLDAEHAINLSSVSSAEAALYIRRDLERFLHALVYAAKNTLGLDSVLHDHFSSLYLKLMDDSDYPSAHLVVPSREEISDLAFGRPHGRSLESTYS